MGGKKEDTDQLDQCKLWIMKGHLHKRNRKSEKIPILEEQ